MSEKSTNTPISVVIPSYNGQQLLAKNLPAVCKILQKGDELIIIDDAGTDSSIEWLTTFAADYPQFTWQISRNNSNLRFGATVNTAVNQASHDLIFLLNNDVSPHPDCRAALQPYFDQLISGNTFAVGCKEIEPAINQIGGKNKLWFERGLFVHSRADNFESGQTAWASGGSALFSRPKWLELGGFDPAYYPAYWEDIDLSFRARLAGYKVLFSAEAVVDHNHESTNADTFGQKKLQQLSIKHQLTFTWRHASGAQKIAHLCWLPYHLVFTSLRTQGIFFTSWLQWLLS